MTYCFVILFYAKKLNQNIKDKINDIEFGIIHWKLLKAEEREKAKDVKSLRSKKRKKIKIKRKRKKSEVKDNINIIKLDNNNNYNENNNDIIIQDDNQNCDKVNEIKLPKSRKRNTYLNNNNNNLGNILIIKNKNEKDIFDNYSQNIDKTSINKSDIVLENKEDLEKTRKIMQYNDEELNNLEYELALKLDIRSYCQYYISLLRTKHNLIFTFFNNNDYNSKLIKIDLFLFSFVLYYATNTLFFNDNTMHKIYEDKGDFNFNYQLPQITYSFLISALINTLLKLLALSQGLILDFKRNKEKQNLEKRKEELNNKIRNKFILYFILSSFLLLFLWYYISMFCAIYNNTQIHLIKDTLISFVLSLFYLLGIYLIPGIFRIHALSNSKSKRIYLYRISKVIQMI